MIQCFYERGGCCPSNGVVVSVATCQCLIEYTVLALQDDIPRSVGLSFIDVFSSRTLYIYHST
jgi:hypothetical protein